MLVFHILVISDIHLGSLLCNARELLEFLQGCIYDVLIVLGDLYEDGQIISDEQFEIIRYLRQNREKVIYIRGNHDWRKKKSGNGILGIPTREEYEWSVGGKNFYALHGDRFDRFLFIFDEPLVDKIFYRFTWLFKMINIFGVNGTNWHDGVHKFFSNLIDKRAIKHTKAINRKRKKEGNENAIDVTICGHTHKPVHVISYDKNGKEVHHYVNSGGWVDGLCSYVAIDKNGKVKLDSLAPQGPN